MSVTATELKNNLGKYLVLSATEDIFITKNGKVVADTLFTYDEQNPLDKEVMASVISQTVSYFPNS